MVNSTPGLQERNVYETTGAKVFEKLDRTDIKRRGRPGEVVEVVCKDCGQKRINANAYFTRDTAIQENWDTSLIGKKNWPGNPNTSSHYCSLASNIYIVLMLSIDRGQGHAIFLRHRDFVLYKADLATERG